MQMIGYEKVKLVKTDLAERGIPLNKAVPPVWRLLWRLGVAAPPPLFLGFRTCTALTGCMFGLIFGLMFWWEPFSPHHSTLWGALIGAFTGAAFMGPSTAAYLKGVAHDRRIPRWNTYGKTRDGGVDSNYSPD